MENKEIAYALSLGAVFKIQIDGERALMLSERLDDGQWTPANRISDKDNVYAKMGSDQVSIAIVAKRNGQLNIKDIFSLTVECNGDTSSVGKAIKDKVLPSLLDACIKDWKKTAGPILDLKGNKTILWLDTFKAMYDYCDREALRKAYRDTLGQNYAEEPAALQKAATRFDAFLAKLEQGDEIYWFVHAEPRAARIGYAIMRGGCLAAALVEMMG